MKDGHDQNAAGDDAGNELMQVGGVRTLGWAAYLACSWTWCIGMFLPVLLVRDFGVWAFVVFALPNVIGAGAMGWVLRSAGTASIILQTHRWAVSRFSLVTVAFHLFFLGWMVTVLMPGIWINVGLDGPAIQRLGVLGVSAMVVGVAATRASLPLASIVMWIVSLGTGAMVMWAGAWDDFWHTRAANSFRSLRTNELLMLAPACVLGFALCPYLDATFLHARRQLGRTASRVAFGVGFGVFFLVMILFTLGYSAAVRPLLVPISGGGAEPRIAIALWSHLLLQSVFTIAVHLRAVPREVQARLNNAPRRLGNRTAVVLGVIGGAALIGAGYATGDYNYRSMMLGEVLYRVFMSFYGLVFPAYVLICMIPTGHGERVHSGLGGGTGRVKLRVWLASVVVATPFYWLGFIDRLEEWLIPGLLVLAGGRGVVVLLARRAGVDQTDAAATGTASASHL